MRPIAFDEAAGRLLALARPLGRQQVTLDRAQGRRLVAPVRARLDAPRFAVSTMDGYAVRQGEWPGPWTLAGQSFPGEPPAPELRPGTARRVFTGGPVPVGADMIVPQENMLAARGEVQAVGSAGEGAFIRAAASDFARGTVLLEAGRVLDARALVAAAAGDCGRVAVWRRPRVAIVTTGDELAAPGHARARAAAVPDSVGPGLAALASDWGARVVGQARVGDDAAALTHAVAAAADRADVVVLAGGASVGARDHARGAAAAFGREVFAGVAMRPGKPVWCVAGTGPIILGVPGNPTSAMVAARLFLAPLLSRMGGGAFDDALAWQGVTLVAPLPPAGAREHFARARRTAAGAVPIDDQRSGMQAALAGADLLLRQPGGGPALAAGARLPALVF